MFHHAKVVKAFDLARRTISAMVQVIANSNVTLLPMLGQNLAVCTLQGPIRKQGEGIGTLPKTRRRRESQEREFGALEEVKVGKEGDPALVVHPTGWGRSCSEKLTIENLVNKTPNSKPKC